MAGFAIITPGMVALLALVPPLWHRVMDRRIRALTTSN